jgi:ferrous iron transport protein B
VGAFFGASAFVITALYLFGIIMILISGLFLKKFRGFIGKPSPFIMELPVYHMPTVRNVLMGVKEKSWSFIKNAGTIILLSAVLIWVLSSFTFTGTYLGDSATTDSILSSLGKALCWIFVPLGFGGSETWELTVASFTGIAAKENLLATLAVLLDSAVGIDGLPTTEVLTEYLSVTAYPEAVAMSFLVFNLICAPCIASIAAIYRELHSHKKLMLALLYQCATAYGVAGIFYQTYVLLHGDIGLGALWLVLFIAVPVYVIFSKQPFGFLNRRDSE